MGSGFQENKDRSTAGSLLEGVRRLTRNAAEVAQSATASREHIASLRGQIEEIRNLAAGAQSSSLRQTRGENANKAALGAEADSSARDPHDPQGGAVILTVLLVVFIGIISRASRR